MHNFTKFFQFPSLHNPSPISIFLLSLRIYSIPLSMHLMVSKSIIKSYLHVGTDYWREHCLSNDRLLTSELSVHSGCTCWFTSNIPAVDYTVIYGKTAVWNI